MPIKSKLKPLWQVLYNFFSCLGNFLFFHYAMGAS